MNPPTDGAAPRPSTGAAPRRAGPSYGRALRVGLGVSALVHLVAIAYYGLLPPLEPQLVLPAGSVEVGAEAGQGMRVVDLVPVEDGGERPAAPEEIRPTERPGVRSGTPDVSDPNRGGIVAPGPTAAERLRPRLSDERLWAPLDAALNELTLEQRLELELSGKIADWQDSLAVALESERALTDWTRTDAEGRRWGVSEGKLHLGDITLPLPFSFGTPVGRRDEAARAAWEWEEIQRGATAGTLRDSWKERAKAIRERRDRERARARPDTSGVRR